MESSEERRYLLALACLYSNRPRQLRRLKEMYGTALEAWKHISEQGMNAALQRADEEEEFIAKHAISVWTEEDEETLSRMFDNGCSKKDICAYFKRTEGAIAARLVQLEKIQNRDEFRYRK